MVSSKKVKIFFVFIFVTFILFISCDNGTPPDDEHINYAIIEKLKNIVTRDLVVFESSSFPPSTINSLTEYKAIIFGELHTIGEERELVSNLAIKLADKGIKTEICLESPNAYNWVYEKFSIGEISELPDWANYNLRSRAILDSVIKYNSVNDNKVKIKCIDANIQPHFFSNSFKGLAEYMSDNKLLTEYRNNFPNYSANNYFDELLSFKNILAKNPEIIGLTKEDDEFNILTRMLDDEIISVNIRTNWQTDYLTSFSSRENIIKANAEYHLSNNDGTIIFYFGCAHAQKKSFIGSDVEWLADYLYNRNTITIGRTISIVGVPLKGEIINSSNTDTFNFDLVTQSKADDLFRIVGEINSTDYSWLALSDPVFSENKIRAKYIYSNYEIEAPLKEQYDAFIFIPNGTYAGW